MNTKTILQLISEVEFILKKLLKLEERRYKIVDNAKNLENCDK